MLFARFLARASARMGRPLPPINHTVRRHLIEHDWPGNLRELSNFANQVAIGLTDSAPDSPQDSLARRVARYEAELIREALSTHRGDIRKVTAALRLPRKTLYDKMARHGIQPADHRDRD
jgi:two-component system C4-dicarboxylate transport response regulator DctD